MIRRPPRSTLFPTRRSSDLEVSSVARTCVLDRGPEFRDCVCSVQQPEGFPYSRSSGPVEAEGEDLLGRGIEATESHVGHRRRLPWIQGILPMERAVRSPPASDVGAQMRSRLDQFSVGVFQTPPAFWIVERPPVSEQDRKSTRLNSSH